MLPRGWSEATVAELAGPSGLVTDGDWVESKDQDQSGTVRLTQLADIGVGKFRDRSARFMNAEAAERLNCTYLQAGDVLIARMPDPIGRACIFPGLNQPAVTAVDVMLWRTDGLLASADWFERWINSPEVRAAMTAGAGGTTRQRIAGGRIKEFLLPFPPLPEQQRIVAKLDVLTVQLARVRAELERVPKLANSLRQKVLQTTFGSVSQTSPLGKLVSFVTSGSRGWAKYYAEDGPAFIRVGDVRRRDIRLDLHGLQRVQPPKGSEGIRTALRTGDIVVTITADLGRVGVVPDDLGQAFVNQHVALVRPIDTHEAKWIAWYLSSEGGQEQLLAKDRGVTKAGLGLDDIRNVNVPVVEKHERDLRLSKLDAAFARAERLESEAARTCLLLDRLEAAILAKAFRGELVLQDPADEPASVLLERIRTKRAVAPIPKRKRLKMR